MIQHTYILDTNVYGELLTESDREVLVQKISTNKTTIIYGVDVIELELKNAPKDVKYKGIFFRNALMELFESLVDEVMKVTPIARYLAVEYFKKYVQLKNSGKYYNLIKDKRKKYSEDDLKVDFQIIAVASLNSVDVVVSSDTRTMLSDLSKDVYEYVNKINGLRTPKLIEYEDFKENYLK